LSPAGLVSEGGIHTKKFLCGWILLNVWINTFLDLFFVLEISHTADERLMAYLMLDVTALMLGGSLEALMAGSGFWSPHA
jgi:hypothetical protein